MGRTKKCQSHRQKCLSCDLSCKEETKQKSNTFQFVINVLPNKKRLKKEYNKIVFAFFSKDTHNNTTHNTRTIIHYPQ